MSKNFELMREQFADNVPDRKPILAERPALGRPRQTPHFNPNQNQWLSGLTALEKHWRLAAAFAAMVLLTVTVTVFVMKPIYEPIARIEVDPPGAELFSLQGPDSRTDPTEYLQTQVSNLQSDQLAIAVIRKLHLDGSGPNGSVDVQQQTPTADPSTVALSQSENRALAALRSSLTIKRDTSSHLINVSFASHEPKRAALVANTLVEEFIDMNYRTRHEAIMQSTKWLSSQLDDIRTRMQESDRALADFQRESGVADIGESQSTYGAKMTELSRQMMLAQADRIQLQSLLARVNGAAPEAVPQVTSDPVVQDLLKKLADSRSQLSQALAFYGKNHPNVKRLQAQVDELETQLTSQKKSILGGMKTNYAAASAREGMLNSEIKSTTKELSKVVQYDALRKEADANEALYNNLYARVKEAGIAAESKSSNIRWVDRARVLNFPTRPNRPLAIALGLIAGMFGGVLLAFIRESFDTRLRTLEDVKNWTGLSEISVMPEIEGGKNRKRFWLARRKELLPQPFLLQRPQSTESEAMRALFTSVHLSRAGRSPQVVLVSSSFPGEGKTTIAINMAIALARHGTTCLLDADLRKTGIAKVFGIEAEFGLAGVLNGSIELERAMFPVASVRNLTVVPCGLHAADVGELVCSSIMQDVIRDLRMRFKYVVVDAPPILPFADARAISPLVDGIIFVGRSGITTREAMRRSLELLEEMHGAPILEVVLNGVNINSAEYRYHYGYRYKQ